MAQTLQVLSKKDSTSQFPINLWWDFTEFHPFECFLIRVSSDFVVVVVLCFSFVVWASDAFVLGELRFRTTGALSILFSISMELGEAELARSSLTSACRIRSLKISQMRSLSVSVMRSPSTWSKATWYWLIKQIALFYCCCLCVDLKEKNLFLFFYIYACLCVDLKEVFKFIRWFVRKNVFMCWFGREAVRFDAYLCVDLREIFCFFGVLEAVQCACDSEVEGDSVL